MRYINIIAYFCKPNLLNLKTMKMKSSFFAIVALGFVALTSCGNSANINSKTDTSVASTASAEVVTTAENNVQPEGEPSKSSDSEGKVIHLDKKMFISQVFDFEKNPEKWNYIGSKPCIIDFYADWCKPCKMVAPIMDELAAKYKGEVIIYKVNTDEQREIAQAFGIRSIPTVFFCPMGGDPQLTQGALPKEQFEEILNKVLLNK